MSSLVLVECSLGSRVVSIKQLTKRVIEGLTRYIAKSSSKSSESDGTLYHISSLSLVNLSERSLSDESGGEESSN